MSWYRKACGTIDEHDINNTVIDFFIFHNLPVLSVQVRQAKA